MSERQMLDWDYHRESWLAHAAKQVDDPPAHYDQRGRSWWRRGWRDRAEEVFKGEGPVVSRFVPHLGEVLTLKCVYREGAAFYADTDKGNGVRLPLQTDQIPPRVGDRVTVGEEGFTCIERPERGNG